MAANKTEKKYLVKIKTNPNFCGKDAGEIQFAHGEAIIPDCRMVAWFREHDGYEVTEIKEKDE